MAENHDNQDSSTFFEDTTEVGIDLPAYRGDHPFNDIDALDAQAPTKEEAYTHFTASLDLPQDPLLESQIKPAADPVRSETNNETEQRYGELQKFIRNFEEKLTARQCLFVTCDIGSGNLVFRPTRIALWSSGIITLEGINKHGRPASYFTAFTQLTFGFTVIDMPKNHPERVPIEFRKL